MKKISLILIFIVCFISSFGQIIQRTNNYGTGWKRAIADSMFAVPFKDTIPILVEITPVERRPGFVTCRPQDSLYYSFNGIKWSRIINYKEFIDSINAVKQLIAGGGVSYTGTQGIVVTGTVIRPDTSKLATVSSLTNYVKYYDKLGTSTRRWYLYVDGANDTYIRLGDSTYSEYSVFESIGLGNYWSLRSADNHFTMAPKVGVNSVLNGSLGTYEWAKYYNGTTEGTAAQFYAASKTTTDRAAYFQWNTSAGSGVLVVGYLDRTGMKTWAGVFGPFTNYRDSSINHQVLIQPEIGSGNRSAFTIKGQHDAWTGNYISIFTEYYWPLFIVDHNGYATAKSFLVPQDTTINSNYTVPDSINVIYVNTAGGNITITLPSSRYNGQNLEIRKISSDNHIVTIASTTNIDGNGSINFADNRSINIHYNGTEYWSNNLIRSQDVDHVDASDFGAVADLERATFNTVADNDTITATTSIFASTDVGKVIVIHEVRDNTAYSDTAQALTTTITAYVASSSGTKVVVATAPDYTRNGKMGYVFTNNFTALQDAIDYCALFKIGRLHINNEGTYGIAPQLDSTAIAQPALWKGLTITTPLTIQGDGKNTKLKWCIEDDNNVDSADNWYGYGFIVNTSGDVSFKNFQALSPDHLCSEMVPHRLTFSVQKTGQVLTGSCITDNVDIIGDSLGRAYDWPIQWSSCFDNSAEAYPGKYNFTVTNSTMMASGQWISIFSSDGAAKKLNVLYTPSWYSGSPKLRTVWGNHANITSGDQTLTITGVPGFSWYDFTSQYNNENRKPEIRIKSGSDSVTVRIVSINSPTSAEVDVAPGVTFTNAQIVYIGRGEEGHGIYRHPNVSPTYIGLLAYNTNQWIDHAYTGGGVNGTQEYPTYMQDCGEYTFNPIYPTVTRGWMIAKNQTLRHTIKNCDSLTINEYNYSPMINIYGTVLRGESTFAGNTNIYNSVGGNIYANGDTVKVYGGTYDFIGQINAGDITIFNANVGTATPSSSVKLYGCYNNSGTAY